MTSSSFRIGSFTGLRRKAPKIPSRTHAALLAYVAPATTYRLFDEDGRYLGSVVATSLGAAKAKASALYQWESITS